MNSVLSALFAVLEAFQFNRILPFQISAGMVIKRLAVDALEAD